MNKKVQMLRYDNTCINFTAHLNIYQQNRESEKYGRRNL